MGINSTEVSYSFGQLGSMFTNSTSTAISPPTGKVFVAITFLEDTTFDASSGLVADASNVARGLQYVGTASAAHDIATATVDEGSGGKVVDNTVNFQAGLTIYGRWSAINLSTGAIIAYIGD
tara:strand:- start:159 stop:524 length:366 start_codon:yes stop_codon:yes gene_type:complete